MTIAEEASQPELLTRQQVADLLQCSTRHIDSLRAAGLMPQPIRLGKWPRYRRAQLLRWIEAGCPPAVDADQGDAV